ncbi:MAG: MFS transporter [Hamadaea sp.]|uniref:MFS transporter n=1 Tax=Hamadaea sp. TaxID=2024425 RepID=UPI00181C926E|nr:MFS transporter [Hamadaea sp.]NUR72022.1 MFS transporter [Hamadaea sp.]NUT17572.1 MFS transporter [Hamadaea sp.]
MVTLTSVRRSRWWILAVLALSVLVIGLDGTVLNVALPTLAGDLGAGTDDLQWILDSYIVVFAVALLPAGLLGDRHGRKRWLISGLLLFGAASAVAAYADSVPQLVAARAVMGLGAALIMPLTMSVLPVVFDRAEQPKAIATWSIAVALGVPIGPVLGGYLLDHFQWGSIFLINIPIVVVAVLAAVVLLPESRDPQARRVDLLGAVLSVAGLGSFVYGVILAPVDGWASALPWIAVGLVVLGGFWIRLGRTAYPLIDRKLFADRNFLWGSLAATAASFAMMGVLFVLPQYLAAALRQDALGVGVRLLPMIAGLIVAARLGTRLAARLGARVIVAAGLAVSAVALGLGALTRADDGYAWTAGWLTVLGFGLGLCMPSAMDAVLASLPEGKSGVGSGAVQAMRQVGGALGVAALGSLLSAVYTARLDTSGLPPAVASAASESVLAAVRVPNLDPVPAFLDGMAAVLAASGAVVLLGAVLSAVFLPGRSTAAPVSVAESTHARLEV